MTDTLLEINTGKRDVDICYDHDCGITEPDNCSGVLCGVIGSTNPEKSKCTAYIWENDASVFFLMKIDEENRKCNLSYNRVTLGLMNDASISYECQETNTEGKHKNCQKAKLIEISLTRRGVDKSTYVAYKDYGEK